LDLLNCTDYKQKVAAISTLKNGDGCWHLFVNICNPNFLNSKNFYKDIEMLRRADTARYGLWILGKDSFINSPYHDEDLKLIVETHDIHKENPCDFVVSDALATVAGNIDSIRSPYHRADMQLIAKSGSKCLQMSCTYPEHSLNNLAVSKISLSDRYHLENMQILAKAPVARKFLYKLMTDPNIIKGDNYRDEVESLLNAKSEHTARALYYYIENPVIKFTSDRNFYDDFEYDMEDTCFLCSKYVSGKVDPDYIKNLIRIIEINDRFVMHYVSLLMNPIFIKCIYKNFDLELLKRISNRSIFMDLYRLMSDENSLNSIHHKRDAVIISQTTIDAVRKLLLEIALNEYNLKSSNHEYDMKYVFELNIDSISEETYEAICYYLFNQIGIDDPKHQEKLEQLSQGLAIDRSNDLSSYLDLIQKQIDTSMDDSSQIIETVPVVKPKQKLGILCLLKKHIKRDGQNQ